MARPASILAAILLGTLAVPAGRSAHGVEFDKNLVGRWVISKQSYDQLVKAKLLRHQIPYLIIGADGKFSLVRLMPYCWIWDKAGKPIWHDSAKPEFLRRCLGNAEASRKDGIGPYTALSASGQVEITASGVLKFRVQRTGITPKPFADRIRKIAARLPSLTRRWREQGLSDALVQANTKSFRLLIDRLSQLMTTGFVAFGQTANFSIKADALAVSHRGSKWKFSWQRDKRRLAVHAMTMLSALDLPVAKHFSCLLSAMRTADRDGGSRANSLKSMSRLSHKFLAARQKEQRLAIFADEPKNAEKRRRKEIQRQITALLDQIARNPVHKNRERLNVWLGCESPREKPLYDD